MLKIIYECPFSSVCIQTDGYNKKIEHEQKVIEKLRKIKLCLYLDKTAILRNVYINMTNVYTGYNKETI